MKNTLPNTTPSCSLAACHWRCHRGTAWHSGCQCHCKLPTPHTATTTTTGTRTAHYGMHATRTLSDLKEFHLKQAKTRSMRQINHRTAASRMAT